MMSTVYAVCSIGCPIALTAKVLPFSCQLCWENIHIQRHPKSTLMRCPNTWNCSFQPERVVIPLQVPSRCLRSTQPAKEMYFICWYSQYHSFGHYPEVLGIGPGWNGNQTVNWEASTSGSSSSSPRQSGSLINKTLTYPKSLPCALTHSQPKGCHCARSSRNLLRRIRIWTDSDCDIADLILCSDLLTCWQTLTLPIGALTPEMFAQVKLQSAEEILPSNLKKSPIFVYSLPPCYWYYWEAGKRRYITLCSCNWIKGYCSLS